MKNSKKGVTLVELVICCAILVLLAGACTALLVSGQSAFNTSSQAANSQLESSVLQTHLLNIVPRASNIVPVDATDTDTFAQVKEMTQADGHCLYFQDGVLVIRTGGKDYFIDTIAEFEYDIQVAGPGASDSVTEEPTTPEIDAEEDEEDEPLFGYPRAQLVYKVTLTDGNSYRGGFVMSNIAYERLLANVKTFEEIDGMLKLSKYPLTFPAPEEPSET